MVELREVWRQGIAKLRTSQGKQVRFIVYRASRYAVRVAATLASSRTLKWVARLQRVRWLDETTLEIEGYAFKHDVATDDGFPDIVVRLRARGKKPIEMSLTHRREREANLVAESTQYNYDNTGFTATLDVADLVRRSGSKLRTWYVEIRCCQTKGKFQYYSKLSSVRYVPAQSIDGVEVQPTWKLWHGLIIKTRRSPAAASTALADLSQLSDATAQAIITKVEILDGPPRIRFSGTLSGDMSGMSMVLAGARAWRAISLDKIAEDGTFTGTAELWTSRWNEPALPPRPGQYMIDLQTSAGRIPVLAGEQVLQHSPKLTALDKIELTVGVTEGQQIALQVSPRREDDEVGAFYQRKLRDEYQRDGRPLKRQFYFETFRGTLAICNPLAIARELVRRFPDIPKYWGVTHPSVPVPEGVTPVLLGSREAWDARQSSQWVVLNSRFGGNYRHMPGQLVLQTWHGTMYKRIGLDWGVPDAEYRRGLLAARDQWDFFLSQNPHSSRVFQSAYAWEKEIWEEGYPRNDDIFNQPREPIRRLLGIKDGQSAVLYAPTWRENQTGMVNFFDLKRLAADLGDDYVILLRGHARTARFNKAIQIPGVIDVGAYPDITDLFIAADILITDYSSVMFDFANTGRPMIFFVPDMDDYRRERNAYFDLIELAPGPVVRQQSEVVSAIRTATSDEPRYRERYAAWRARFTPWDDGHCAQRIVDRLLAAAPDA